MQMSKATSIRPVLMAGLLLAAASGCGPQRLEVVECVGECEGTGSGGRGSGAGGTATSGGGGAAASGFPESLVHRYDFEGQGNVVVDRVGTAHGMLFGTELGRSHGRGVAVLAGGDSGQYVELPRGIVSALANATFEAWITWNGQAAWERIFDFGDALLGDGGEWVGRTYLFLTPRTPSSTGAVMRVGQQRADQPEFKMDAERALPVNALAQVALVVDNARRVLQLFVDGELIASSGLVAESGESFDALATLNDESNWLGRSLYEQDAEFGGTFHDFRIYDAALSPSAIEASFLLGPDPEAAAD